MLYPLLRTLLFSLPPEVSHRLVLGTLDWLHQFGLDRFVASPAVAGHQGLSLMGIRCPNPVGLAAGMDKNGDYIDALASLGFGFIEVGTVTPRPQQGNPSPRIWRDPPQTAILNALGFNNHGVEHLVNRLEKSQFLRKGGVVGVNIGKNFDTPEKDTILDYLFCMRLVYPHCTYITVNISSPNTPGLRDLHQIQALRTLLSALKNEQNKLNQRYDVYRPIAIKLSPDLELAHLDEIAQSLTEFEVDGVIATNTTVEREGLSASLQALPAGGGVSGKPLKTPSNRILSHLTRSDFDIPIIGVGGILSTQDGLEKLSLGATAFQLYTGLIFNGPEFVNHCIRAWAKVHGMPS